MQRKMNIEVTANRKENDESFLYRTARSPTNLSSLMSNILDEFLDIPESGVLQLRCLSLLHLVSEILLN